MDKGDENLSSEQADFFMNFLGYIPEPRTLLDREAHNEIAYISDLHSKPQLLEMAVRGIRERANGKRTYIALGDQVDRSHGMFATMNQVGFRSSQEIQFNHLRETLSNDGLEAYTFLSTVNGKYGGIDNYIGLHLEEGIEIDEQAVRESYNKAQEISNNLDLEGKLERLSKDANFVSEMQNAFLDERAFDRAYVKVSMYDTVRKLFELNKEAIREGHEETIAIDVDGNHDLSYDSGIRREIYDELLQKEGVNGMKSADEVILVGSNIHGAMELGDGDDAIRFQYSSNCYNQPAIGQNILNQEFEKQLLYLHMFDQTQEIGFDPKKVKDLKLEEALQSLDFQRMSGIGVYGNSALDDLVGNPLDFIMTHQEIGYNLRGYEHITGRERVAVNKGLLYLIANHTKKDEQGLTRVNSGHFHAPTIDDNIDADFGVRNRRDGIGIIGKSGTERIKVPRGVYAENKIGLTEEGLKMLNKYMQIEKVKLAKVYGINVESVNSEIVEESKAA